MSFYFFVGLILFIFCVESLTFKIKGHWIAIDSINIILIQSIIIICEKSLSTSEALKILRKTVIETAENIEKRTNMHEKSQKSLSTEAEKLIFIKNLIF